MKRFYKEDELVFQSYPKNPFFKDLKNLIFEKLLVIGYGGKDKNGITQWYCKCDCGNIILTHGASLSRKSTKSCGCIQKEVVKKVNTTHGQNRKTITHSGWQTMIQRCTNSKAHYYHRYGGRGITVCEKWLKFEGFFEDMGERPEGLSLDRIDNNKGYCKENCRWATQKEQMNNVEKNIHITFLEETKTIRQWAEIYKINFNTLYSRIFLLGWSHEKALLTPINYKNKK